MSSSVNSSVNSPVNQVSSALVVGSTGIVGLNLSNYLQEHGWKVYGLARSPGKHNGVSPITADLLDTASVEKALKDIEVDHIFFTTWARRSTEEENVEANSAMLNNLLAPFKAKKVKHVALVTGTKQYLGSFSSYGQTTIESPFREDSPRVPGPNFYYNLEDIVFEFAKASGAGYTVHRPHTIIGFAHGNMMNMGVTLAVYASLCKAQNLPFVFPGSKEQWNFLTDLTDAHQLAANLHWAASDPKNWNEAYNVTNGDIFRWRWLWPQIANYFGITSEGPGELVAPLEAKMKDAQAAWTKLSSQHQLVESDLGRLASWWHTDADLGRKIECVNDTSKIRLGGFSRLQRTADSFTRLFDLLRISKFIP